MAIPGDSCDPGSSGFNVTQIVRDNARVAVTIRSTWDGVSAWPNCDGPIVDVTLRNTSPKAWLLSVPFGRTSKTRTVASSANRIFSGTQLATIGLVNTSDLADLTLTDMSVAS
jgi:hypothetical protein